MSAVLPARLSSPRRRARSLLFHGAATRARHVAATRRKPHLGTAYVARSNEALFAFKPVTARTPIAQARSAKAPVIAAPAPATFAVMLTSRHLHHAEGGTGVAWWRERNAERCQQPERRGTRRPRRRAAAEQRRGTGRGGHRGRSEVCSRRRRRHVRPAGGVPPTRQPRQRPPAQTKSSSSGEKKTMVSADIASFRSQGRRRGRVAITNNPPNNA